MGRRSRLKPAKLAPLARMVLTTRDARQDKPIFLEDALRLYNEGKIHELAGGSTGDRAFCMPRSLEQMIADTTPAFSVEVMTAIRKAQDAGGKL